LHLHRGVYVEQMPGDVILDGGGRSITLPGLDDPNLRSLYAPFKKQGFSCAADGVPDRLKLMRAETLASYIDDVFVHDRAVIDERRGGMDIAKINSGERPRGVCLEMSVALWGLLKIEGFDARIGGGMPYTGLLFFHNMGNGHAWVNVFIGGKRYIVDPLRANPRGEFVLRARLNKSANVMDYQETPVELLRVEN
jgi:hypothetical protein